MEPLREFPSADDWRGIFAESEFASLLDLAGGCRGRAADLASDDIDALAARFALSRLEIELHNRVVDVARSHVFMRYYHSLGIPDERWRISPGRSGQSVEYFPDFKRDHFIIKGWFDFYGDTFYQKVFAAWAVVGHVLNQTFSLGLEPKQIDFEPAVRALPARAADLRAALLDVLEHTAFAKARSLRNDITHNESPSSVGMTVSRCETPERAGYTFGMKFYEPSAGIFQNATECVVLLRQTLDAIQSPISHHLQPSVAGAFRG